MSDRLDKSLDIEDFSPNEASSGSSDNNTTDETGDENNESTENTENEENVENESNVKETEDAASSPEKLAEIHENLAEVTSDDMPYFLRDAVPDKKTHYIKWALMHNQTAQDLVADGFNPGSVRNAEFELEKDGYRERPDKKTAIMVKNSNKSVGAAQQKALKPKGEEELKLYAKGSPAESLIEHFVRLPDAMKQGQGEGQTFEAGMRFGLSCAVLGIRMAQELSNLGVSQVKPMIEMTKSMREGETLASKNAAKEAAMESASMIGDIIAPSIRDMKEDIKQIQVDQRENAKKAKTASSDNPMREVMMDRFMPMMENMMDSLMPGMGGMRSSGESKRSSGPTGWTKEEK